MIVLAASLPLPISTNALHRPDFYERRVRLTDTALEYIDNVLRLLNYYNDVEDKNIFAPYEIAYLNMEAITRIRQLRNTKSRAKAVLAQHRLYRMDTLLVVNNERSDLDNFHKLLQDTLCSWLGFNDRRIIEIHSKIVVDKTIQPHVEVVMRETERTWEAGDLLAYAKAELAVADLATTREGAALQ